MNWRSWVLAILFAGPFLAYVGFGFLWLLERGWIWPTIAGVIWIATGVAFSLLASRWTRRKNRFLPYLDETAPDTFAPLDQRAWSIVLEEAAFSETVPATRLTEIDFYIEAAKSLAIRLAKVYHPDSEDPIEHVPVLEALTAFELAAEDLSNMSRQIPGSDLITPIHVKKAVQAAGYLQKASDWYGYLLPLINPATGIPRLASQHLMVKPAWRDMQQNLLRWFYQAFINRLGVHLIELYSGRLVVGAGKYRQLMKGRRVGEAAELSPVEQPVIALAGSSYSNAAKLMEAVPSGDESMSKLFTARLEGQGLTPSIAQRLAASRWNLIPAYTARSGPEAARDRSTRKRAVEIAIHSDLLILVIDDRSEGRESDLAFLQAWNTSFLEHPEVHQPPVLVAVCHADDARITGIQSLVPPFVSQVIAIDLDAATPADRLTAILPSLQLVWSQVERAATIRQLSEASSRSKAGRLFHQLGQHGLKLYEGLRKSGAGSAGK